MSGSSSSSPDQRSHARYIPEPIPIQPRPPGTNYQGSALGIGNTVPSPRGASLSTAPSADSPAPTGVQQVQTSVSGIKGVHDPLDLVDSRENAQAAGGLQAPALQVTGATPASEEDAAPIAEGAPRSSFSGSHPPPFSFRSASQLEDIPAKSAPTDIQTDQLDVSDFEGDEDDTGADADSSAPSSRRHSSAGAPISSFSSLHPAQPKPGRASFGQQGAHSTSPAAGLGSLLKRVKSQREAAEQAASESWQGEEEKGTQGGNSAPPTREGSRRQQSVSAPSAATGEQGKMSPSPKRDEESRKERGFGHRSTSSSGGLSVPRHQLNALSPLQHFSPLNATSPPHRQRPKVATTDLVYNEPAVMTGGGIPNSASMPGLHSASLGNMPGSPGRQHQRNVSASGALPDNGSQGRRSRAGSVTSKLSRRDSLIARGEGGLGMTSSSYAGSEPGGLSLSGLPSPMLGPSGDGRTPYTPGGSPGGLISRLTLVKAPNKGRNDKENENAPLKQRTRSSSNLAPLSESSAMSGSFGSTGTSMSSIKPKTPRSFSLVGDYGPAMPGGQDSAPGRRLSFLFGSAASSQNANPTNIHEGPKALSPNQVVDMAESLRSPVLAYDGFEDDAPPTSLSRSSSYRKPRSASTFSTAKQRSEDTLQQQQQEEKDKLTEQLELEPVEYVEMHDDVLLPFVDRSAEVAELFEVPFNAELLDIIKPTFPTDSQADPAMPSTWRLVDPAKWTWDEFKQHMAENRADCDDAVWVKRFRQAVRARSEAMWEKIGVCLGCDSDLLNIGDVPDALATGRAMTDVFDTDDEMPTPALFGTDDQFGFEGDDDGRSTVYIEPLAPADESDGEASDDGRSSRSSVPGTPLSEGHPGGRSVSPLPGASGAMETIGEEGTSGNSTDRGSKPTPSQVAGGRGHDAEPMMDVSPFAPRKISLPEDPLSPTKSHRRQTSDASSRVRAKSFVGLQITTLPSLPTPSAQQQRSGSFFPAVDHPHFERGPGSPLFPTSFSSLSLAPTLPNNNPNLKMSSRMSFSGFGGALSGTGGAARQNLRASTAAGMGGRPWMELTRKKSTGGMSRMSDSALTLGSEFGEEVGSVA